MKNKYLLLAIMGFPASIYAQSDDTVFPLYLPQKLEITANSSGKYDLEAIKDKSTLGFFSFDTFPLEISTKNLAADRPQIVEKAPKTYFIKRENDTIIKSSIVDKDNIANLKNIIKDSTGLMEPVLFVDASLSLKIDKESTEHVYKILSKNYRLKPISDTYKYAEVFINQIMRHEIDRQTEQYTTKSANEKYYQSSSELGLKNAAALEGKVDKIVKKHKSDAWLFLTFPLVVLSTPFTLILAAKDATDNTKEYAIKNNLSEDLTIYNNRFKETIDSPVFDNVSYLIILNKENYFVDRLASIHNEKSNATERIKKSIQENRTKSDTFAYYWHYHEYVQEAIDHMRAGVNYANVSIRFSSVDRLKETIVTGENFFPELTIMTTDTNLLFETINAKAHFANHFFHCTQYFSPTDYKAEDEFNKSCWQPMLQSYEKDNLWLQAAGNQYVVDDINKTKQIYMRQLDYALEHLNETQKKFEISGKLESNKL